MSVRKKVECSQCGASIVRVTWSYKRGEPIKRFFCGHACKGEWQKAQREALGYDRDWLEDQYHVQGKSANAIAREVGRDPKRVWEWIRDYGMETRPRGTDYGQCFERGHAPWTKGKKMPEYVKEKIRQASIADGRVPYLKDGKHWLHHEGAKPATWKGGISPDRQAFYATKEWKDAVKAVWSRDSAICQLCGKSHNDNRSEGAFHVHHIVSFANKDLRADPNNLVLLCRPCHLFVHSKKNTDRKFLGDKDGY